MKHEMLNDADGEMAARPTIVGVQINVSPRVLTTKAKGRVLAFKDWRITQAAYQVNAEVGR